MRQFIEMGDKHFFKGQYIEALKQYQEAEKLIDEETDSNLIKKTIIAIGDALYFLGEYDVSRDYFIRAFNYEGEYDNPYVNMRLGQCYCKLGSVDKGRFYILKAYELAGEDYFIDEEETLQIIESII